MHKLMPQDLHKMGRASVVEQVSFPAQGGAGNGSCTCLSHTGQVNFAAQDDNGRLLAKLVNALFNYLRNRSL